MQMVLSLKYYVKLKGHTCFHRQLCDAFTGPYYIWRSSKQIWQKEKIHNALNLHRMLCIFIRYLDWKVLKTYLIYSHFLSMTFRDLSLLVSWSRLLWWSRGWAQFELNFHKMFCIFSYKIITIRHLSATAHKWVLLYTKGIANTADWKQRTGYKGRMSYIILLRKLTIT